MGALRFIARRLIFSAALVLGVSFILFALINAIGNPVEILMAETPGVTEETVAAISKYYGLDGPFLERYLSWLGAIAHGDFGTSIIYNQPVGELLGIWGLETLKIQVPAILLATLLATAAGVVAAMRQHSWADFSVVSGAMLGHSLPGFLIGILLILGFSSWLGVFPSYGAYSTRNLLWNSIWADGLWHMVLPVAMLTVFNTATLTLLMRSSLVEVLRQDFITAAWASGLPRRRVVMGHALRNAFIPVLTYLGTLFGLMLGTAPVTETVFTWPGLGALYIQAIQQLDYPVIMGETMVITTMLVTATLLTDIAYVLIDPRIRLG
ncbi:ABC transporter permease [Roseomonas elaeocarpi]|uniref:ABC transporter permease n=1 Tax=Roseomonas elaeocarpi TaxID=907779 RepID=A0ABV6JPU2_9PROT